MSQPRKRHTCVFSVTFHHSFFQILVSCFFMIRGWTNIPVFKMRRWWFEEMRSYASSIFRVLLIKGKPICCGKKIHFLFPVSAWNLGCVFLVNICWWIKGLTTHKGWFSLCVKVLVFDISWLLWPCCDSSQHVNITEHDWCNSLWHIQTTPAEAKEFHF